MHRLFLVSSIGLLAVFPLGCSGAGAKYATYSSRCEATKNLDDCTRAGVWAAKAGHLEEAKTILFETCHKGSPSSCREFTARFPGETLQRVGSDRLGTTEPLKPAEAEALISRNIHWKIDSEPRGAIINYRINSSSEQVSSTGSIYLDRSPYEGVRRLDVKGLTTNNLKYVAVVLEIEAKGFYPQRKEFQLSAVIQEGELSSFFQLEKVRE